MRRAPATSTRPRARTGSTSSRSSTTRLDWATALPAVLGPGARRRHAAFGKEAIVAAGTGDNMAAALGVGLGPGDVVVSIGTSGTVFAVSDAPTADATGAVASFADATGRFLPFVCTLNATKVTDAIARLLGVDAAGPRRARARGADAGPRVGARRARAVLRR